MINRINLLNRHNPVLTQIRPDSPLSVGNGRLAFTCDITGLQTLYSAHLEAFPLCTMAEWGWHCAPVAPDDAAGSGLWQKRGYSQEDLEQTVYTHNGRQVAYPVEIQPGNEGVYHWLRHNPHKFNIGRFALILNGKQIQPAQIGNIRQELILSEGLIKSSFEIDGMPVKINTLCHMDEDMLAFEVVSEIEGLAMEISFPYGHHSISGGIWDCDNLHTTTLQSANIIHLRRVMDDIDYNVSILSNEHISRRDKHRFVIPVSNGRLKASFGFSMHAPQFPIDYDKVLTNNRRGWAEFWNTCGIADFSRTDDPRAHELERRLILSLYLSRIQSSGLPPAETGLSCNSWYGKFHLEMHLWHTAYLPLWNQEKSLIDSFSWYQEILPEARANATKNGYKGARWPKMVAYDGVDSPSPIAPLLVWQQPHIIYMLEMAYSRLSGEAAVEFMEEHWELLSETADFICDFFVHNDYTDKYDLLPPLIPAQEEFDPRDVRNPAFELAYFHFGLGIAIKWANRLNLHLRHWQKVREQIAPMPESAGFYLSHGNCPETFEQFNRDHPSMVAAFGLLPITERIDKKIASDTLDKVLECWDFPSMWGWDFAMMAMSAARLGRRDLAIDLLLMDSPKNTYATNGHNAQVGRADLPLYLPGNGSLLLAAALLIGGWPDSPKTPGIPENWQFDFENIHGFPE
ncbi:MAG: glycoside hydrolase family 65 [Defluviitaleaceae bacterium]|nr:glycoside hydrolase family 65 [Defluviitaleaceae bacterium]